MGNSIVVCYANGSCWFVGLPQETQDTISESSVPALEQFVPNIELKATKSLIFAVMD